MERKTVRKILIGTGAVIGAGGAIFGVMRMADSGGDGRDGQVFNPSGSAATRTIDGTVHPGEIPTPTRTVTPTPRRAVTPTAIGTAQSPAPTEFSATPTPTDIWTPPGTIWTPVPTHQPTLPPTQPPTAEPTPQPTAVPTPEPTAPVVEGPNYEWAAELINLINQTRLENGLSELTVNQSLMVSGQNYAEFLVTNKLFGHCYDGSPQSRAEREGYVGGVGENLTGGDSPEGALQAWLNSAPHRAALLNQDIRDMGIGAYSNPFTTLFVAEFGNPNIESWHTC